MEKIKEKYLKRLSESFPTIAAASAEIINLQAILNLPKGTEHFVTDIHGEYEAFAHVLKNGSGAVKRKIDDVYANTMSARDKQTLATLIYYPRQKMELVKMEEDNMDDWYTVMMYRLIEVCKCSASKYTRSKVRKALPKYFGYVIEELITEKPGIVDKESYYTSLIDTIIRIGMAEDVITAFCELIQRLVVDHLHIVGDIYDRGPGPHLIMDELMNYHSVDIQWGNHDVVWMGAAAGQEACIANVIRVCARYGNLDILEDGYGINLIPLATFALSTYKDDACENYKVKGKEDEISQEIDLTMKMQKAAMIMQLKAEGQVAKRRPDFGFESRIFLHKIDYEKGTVCIDGQEYELKDSYFPTVNPEDPYAYSEEEAEVMERLVSAFVKCEKLQKHMRFLLNKGGLYKIHNSNLLYHGCVPLDEEGNLRDVELYGGTYRGKALYDMLDEHIRKGFFSIDKEEREAGKDLMWYVWQGENSPLFGKHKMATFERQFLTEKELYKEEKNPYYTLLEKPSVVRRILEDFGLDYSNSHIINGHVPVKVKKGESPVKCNGKVLVIDGGFSKAYQKETGIAGYTLSYNSYGMILSAHEPFESTESAIMNERDIHSERMVVQRMSTRERVKDTDEGERLRAQIEDLEELLKAYRSGKINEKM